MEGAFRALRPKCLPRGLTQGPRRLRASPSVRVGKSNARAREDDVDAEARAARKGLFESDSVTLPCRYESVNRSTQKPIAGRTGLCHAPSRTRSLAAPPSHWPGPRAGVTFDAPHHQPV